MILRTASRPGPAGSRTFAILEAVTLTTPTAEPRGGRRAYLIWSVGVLAYIITVAHRTSMGVAGVEAAERFQIDPGRLSLFVFVQLGVYVAAQIPAGLLVDRFGSRIMLVVSGSLLAAGQVTVGLATVLPVAVLGRVLVGAGDAVVFSAVFSLVPRWFPSRKVALYAQITGMLCQLGQVVSAVPFAAILHEYGWTAAFVAAGAASALTVLLALLFVRNGPSWTPARSASARDILGQMYAVWRRPGTRLGFFGHMGTQFPMMVFTLLWGVPFLRTVHDVSMATIGLLMTLFVICMLAFGMLLGWLSARFPQRRTWLVLIVIAANAAIWTAVLAVPGRAPLWLLVILMVVLASAGPGSMVGIDISRTSNSSANIGIAQAMANMGGFFASLVVLAAMGALMTALGGFTPYAYRTAFLLQYPVWALAVIGVLVYRRKARAFAAAEGEPR